MRRSHEIQPGKGLPGPQSVRPGDSIVLLPGTHSDPLMLAGLRGTKANPITLTCAAEAIVSGPMEEEESRLFLNDEARRRQAGGYYPAVGHLGDLAALTLRDCQFVIVQSLALFDCWPAAIYVDDCRHIAVRDCRIEGSTIAIGVNGPDTRFILIEGNDWRQDMSRDHRMWNRTKWRDIHGALADGNGPVKDGDQRHWDGDFVRCWDIAGDMTIRANKVSDAFNGIHTFNRVDQHVSGRGAKQAPFNRERRSTANVLIEDNLFVRVRDNVVEPEEYAWNWVVRRNRMLDCYLPFSLELDRAGWITIYANQAVAARPYGSELTKPERENFAMFKTGGLQDNEGPINVMFNSFAFNKKQRYFRKGAYSQFGHYNNAVDYRDGTKRFFGSGGRKKSIGIDTSGNAPPLAAEIAQEQTDKRFTRRWNGHMGLGQDLSPEDRALTDLGIAMDGDIVNDDAFPNDSGKSIYRGVGYPLGPSALGQSPRFADDPSGLPEEPEEIDLRPRNPLALNSSVAVTIEFHNGLSHQIPAGLDRGASQSSVKGQKAMAALDAAFEFIPDFTWAGQVSRQPPPASRSEADLIA